MNNQASNHFHFAGQDVVKLAGAYGTPLYVVSEDLIRQRCRQVKTDFLDQYPGSRAAYASKAFLSMAMCRIIESEGFYLDVVSGGELYTAVQAGFPMERVIFHGNNKSLEELEMAVSHRVGRVVVDHPEEIDMLEAAAAAAGATMTIQLRVVPEVEGKTHRHIMTGQKDTKFGIPLAPEIIEAAVKKAVESPHLDLAGFHFHIGSNLFEQEVYVAAVERVMTLCRQLQENLGLTVRELNTGGGYGIQYTTEDSPHPASYYTDAIMATVSACADRLNLPVPQVTIEPGRWIVGEAGITLYTVGAVKTIPGVRTYVSVDGGLPDNIRPALYGAVYGAVVANKIDRPCSETVTVAGKCCETGDILIWDLKTPPLERGDVLAVLSTGAYNESMANNYNRLPRPAVVLLTGDQARLMVDRETREDLLMRERRAEEIANGSL
ncbi:diaminopimelate decarboxylase [Anoxynatronum buryatiense]|uniref:Diaminopimelate decarboxylase n=1 Tax=Anoxynatronum buryatiense TaxID=489973 RepID=A0AA46AIY9_9CLOT|nr:diaminopimelate decarboxylase [Anoxynatronum buryatiense]SMP54674.1 diaminopimelate decarboxylase [Anoxynatronum buryatiense]